MKDYFDEREYIFEKIYFRYRQAYYKGRGVMTWKPNKGFHVEAFLDKNGSIPTKEIYLGGGYVLEQKDKSTIYLKPQAYNKAVIPDVPIKSNMHLFINNRLSITVDQVFFFLREAISNNTNLFSGSALYHLVKKPIFPDCFTSKTTINDQLPIEERTSRTAILNKNPSLWGYMKSEDTLKLNWLFPSSDWTKKDCWYFPEGARYALSILLGQNIQLLQQAMSIGPYTRIGKQKYKSAKKLKSYLLLVQNNQELRKKDFISLAKFFTKERNSTKARICRNIFSQMVDASQQLTFEATQLLLGTIIEGVLRTLYNHPFIPKGKNTFNRNACMTQFQKTYLSAEWCKACDKAMRIFKEIRHRNAHPDWIITPGGSLSPNMITKNIQDMAFLSQFYGYMIKALAGFLELKPNFKNLF